MSHSITTETKVFTVTSPPSSAAPRIILRHEQVQVSRLERMAGTFPSWTESKLANQILKKKNVSWLTLFKWMSFVFLLSGGSGFLALKYNPLFLKGFFLALSIMFVTWLFSVALQDASIVDPIWAFGLMALSWFYYYLRKVDPEDEQEEQDEDGFQLTRGGLIVLLATIWGLRLGLYLWKRKLGHPEDIRYQNFRRQFHPHYSWFSLIQTFLFQGTLMWLISYPLFAGQSREASPLGDFKSDWIGIALWIIGFYFEAVGDYQLAKFKQNPENRGRLLTTGLWSRTRHPNYFGEACMWWGLGLLASRSPSGYYSFLSPTLLTFLLRFISGVTLTDKVLSGSGKPGFREYLKSTNAFFPKLL